MTVSCAWLHLLRRLSEGLGFRVRFFLYTVTRVVADTAINSAAA